MGAVIEKTPYEVLGGENAVRCLVDRFYDLMDQEPDLRELRAMHAQDLGPMRQKLFEFMSGWLGGPPLYFQRPDHPCIGTAHSPYPIGAKERDQWLNCMYRALREVTCDEETRKLIEQALYRTADSFRNR